MCEWRIPSIAELTFACGRPTLLLLKEIIVPENIENLILEHLKRFQAGQERIETKLDELVIRVGQLEGAIL